MTSLPFEDLPPLTFGFRDFYSGYPRKVGPRRAMVAYRKALKRASHDKIIAGRDRYIATKEAWRDWMHPATFLNGDHWEDEADTLPEVKAGIHGGAWKGESLETIAQTVIKYGQSWARCRYPRDVLEQCVAKGLLTVDQMEAGL